MMPPVAKRWVESGCPRCPLYKTLKTRLDEDDDRSITDWARKSAQDLDDEDDEEEEEEEDEKEDEEEDEEKEEDDDEKKEEDKGDEVEAKESKREVVKLKKAAPKRKKAAPKPVPVEMLQKLDSLLANDERCSIPTMHESTAELRGGLNKSAAKCVCVVVWRAWHEVWTPYGSLPGCSTFSAAAAVAAADAAAANEKAVHQHVVPESAGADIMEFDQVTH